MDKRDKPPYKKKTVHGIKKTLFDFYYSSEDYLKQTLNSLFRQDHREVSVYFTTTR